MRPSQPLRDALHALRRVEQIALAESGTAWNKRAMPTSIPKDGKLYWMKPQHPLDDEYGCHAFRRWDASKQRYEESIELAGIVPVTSRHQQFFPAPPRADGTILKEGVGYDPIEIT